VKLLADAAETTGADAGVVGFVAILFIGGMTTLLIFDMVRRIRRTNLRAQIGKKLDAEQAEEQAVKRAQGK
jgi:Flp pilus assembly protein protease CpaA